MEPSSNAIEEEVKKGKLFLRILQDSEFLVIISVFHGTNKSEFITSPE